MEYIRINEGISLPNISRFSPFKCIVIVEVEVSDVWQHEVSRWLAQSGCYYMMAWGVGCSSWDASVDLANIEMFIDEIPDEKFIMTTWHDDEPLSDVFWFCKYLAFNEHHDLKNVIALHISEQDRGRQYLFEYEKV